MRLRGLTAQRDRASKPTVPSMRTSDAQEDQSKRSPDNVRQDECWFSQLRHVRERVRARSIFAWRRAVIPLRPVCWPIRLFVPAMMAALGRRLIFLCPLCAEVRASCASSPWCGPSDISTIRVNLVIAPVPEMGYHSRAFQARRPAKVDPTPRRA